MSFESLLLMRHELLLLLAIVLLLIAEIGTNDSQKSIISPLAIILFALHTIVGFLPLQEGSLFGGMFNTTNIVATMKNILNLGVLIILLQSWKWLNAPENKVKVSEFYIVLFSTLLGMFYMISAGDFLMFYIGLEIATIPLAALAAFNRQENKSAEAGIKLLLSSALSSGILLYGISMIYGTTGSIYFAEISQSITGFEPLQVMAMIFFFSGMAFKISLVPFHLWTADVYEGAPVAITSYLSVISKGAAAFIFMVILFTVFKIFTPVWQDMMTAIAILTMTIGNLFALRQNNLKRYLAFSSIAQAGFILLGIISGTATGMATVVYFILVYIFSNLSAFGVVSIISAYTGKDSISDLNGMYKTNPKLSLALTLALFSLAGIPPVAGFFGKFFLFTAAAEKDFYILVLIALLNTIVSLYYYLMPVKAMFINKSELPIAYFKTDKISQLGLAISIIGMVVIGFASPVYETILSFCFGI
ncbi:MAG TPA: NADH-quinone oxidoreductase subunit N [Bacteroidales bacterium]|nr:MAG: NADH-quinone oxidoreductase subunit N [Bacteroidetes bacterium ADurb.Bin217]HPM13194.1 NADH-quinone oxidoreductase subunit N [Bacteroidales bacterium]